MTRQRFQRADQSDSDCAPSSDGNKPFTSGTGSGTVTASIPAQAMNKNTFSFTMVVGDPGGEDLPASSLMTARLDVLTAESQLTYNVRFVALDASCFALGQADMDESDFTGTGIKTANATWDPPAATDRYQIIVRVSNSEGHSGAAGTITLTSSSNADLVIPDAPGAPPAGPELTFRPKRVNLQPFLAQ